MAWNEEAAPRLKTMAKVLDEGQAQGMTEGQLIVMRRDREQLLERQPHNDALISTVVNVWFSLDSCRSIGMAVGPIPITAVWAWCDRQPWIDDDLRTAITSAINYLDAERSREQANKSKQPPKSKHPKSKP